MKDRYLSKWMLPLVVLLILACWQRTYSADELGTDVISTRFVTEGGDVVSMELPAMFFSGASTSLRRLTGEEKWYTHATLWTDERRTEAFHNAFLEVALRSGLSEAPFLQASAVLDHLQARGEEAGLLLDALQYLDIVYKEFGTVKTGARYILADSKMARLANNLKTLSRRAHAVQKLPAFSSVLATLAVLDVTAEASALVLGTALLTALDHDLAALRLDSLHKALINDQKDVDPAVREGWKRAWRDVTVLRDRGMAGAFLVHLDRHKDDLLASLPQLAVAMKSAGAALLKHKTALADPRLIPFILEYKAIVAIAAHEKEVHLASALATIARALGRNHEAAPLDQNRLYAQWAFYNHMHHAFTAGWVTAFHRFLNRTTQAWADHFQSQAQSMRPGVDEAPVPAAANALVLAPAYIRRDDHPVVLLVDSSGSMKQNDPVNLRIEAVRMFLRGSAPDERVSLWEFDQNASCLAAFGDDTAKKLAAAGRIDASGGTRIGAALATLIKSLDGDSGAGNSPASVVLFTDGKSNDGLEQAEALAAKGLRVFALGLGASVNETMLAQLADATGGNYFHLKNSSDILRFYSGLRSFMGRGQMLAIQQFQLKPKEKRNLYLKVHAADRDMRVIVAWPGSDVGLTLVSPTGQRLQGNAYPGHYREVVVVEPEIGDWIAEITGTDLPVTGETVDLRAEVRNPMFEMKVSGFSNRVDPSSPMHFRLNTNGGSLVRAEAVITGPGNFHKTVSGRVKSKAALFELDGIPSRGNYVVDVTAQMKSFRGTTYERVIRRMFRVDRSGPNQTPQVTGVRGGYLEINLGRSDGLDPGMRVGVYTGPDGEKLAEAFVAAILGEHRAMIEIQTLKGMKQPGKGMFISPNYTSQGSR